MPHTCKTHTSCSASRERDRQDKKPNAYAPHSHKRLIREASIENITPSLARNPSPIFRTEAAPLPRSTSESSKGRVARKKVSSPRNAERSGSSGSEQPDQPPRIPKERRHSAPVIPLGNSKEVQAPPQAHIPPRANVQSSTSEPRQKMSSSGGYKHNSPATTTKRGAAKHESNYAAGRTTTSATDSDSESRNMRRSNSTALHYSTSPSPPLSATDDSDSLAPHKAKDILTPAHSQYQSDDTATEHPPRENQQSPVRSPARPITPLMLGGGNSDSYLIDDDVGSDWSSSAGSPVSTSPLRPSSAKHAHQRSRSESGTPPPQLEKKSRRRSVRNLFGLLKQVI